MRPTGKLALKIIPADKDWLRNWDLVGEAVQGEGNDFEQGTLSTDEFSRGFRAGPCTGQAGCARVEIVLAGSAFVAVCAHVVLPLNFTPVPLTLQTFAVVLLGLLLSPRLAAGTLAAYLAEGALGLPVFSPVPVIVGGMAHLLGPTGGYLLAYPAAAVV